MQDILSWLKFTCNLRAIKIIIYRSCAASGAGALIIVIITLFIVVVCVVTEPQQRLDRRMKQLCVGYSKERRLAALGEGWVREGVPTLLPKIDYK